MPQTCHHLSAITPGLFQITAIRTTRFQHKDTTKSPKQCNKISTRKKCKTQFNGKHKATTLVPNTTTH